MTTKAVVKNTGKEYERIVASIYRQFEGMGKVEDDIKIRGMSGEDRQIDVCVRINGPGTTWLIIVECKDYTDPVGIGRVDELVGKMIDVGAHTGILVSDSGFSQPAINRAKAHGHIELVSVIDTEQEKLRTRIQVPILCEWIHPVWQFTIQSLDGTAFDVTANEVIELHKRFMEMWNTGLLTREAGTHQHISTENGLFQTPVRLIYDYEVERTIYHTHLGMKGPGIYNVVKHEFTTSTPVVTEAWRMEDLETNWNRVTEDKIPEWFLQLVCTSTFDVDEFTSTMQQNPQPEFFRLWSG